MSGKAFVYSRRVFLSLSTLALAQFAAGWPTTTAPASQAQADLARFLRLLGATGHQPYLWRKQLRTALADLPQSLRRELEATARAQALPELDYSAYNLLGSLPVSLPLIELYRPRGLCFVVPRNGVQGGLCGMAFLPGLEQAVWQNNAGFSALILGSSLGTAFGANSSLIVAGLAEAQAPLLRTGATATLATRLCLQQARSLPLTTEILSRVKIARAASFLLYDRALGETLLVSCGEKQIVRTLPAEPQVLVSAGDGLEANADHLFQGLLANQSWLNIEKTWYLLQEAMPGANGVILSVEEHQGMTFTGAAQQPIGF